MKSSLQLWARLFRNHDESYTHNQTPNETVSLPKSKVFRQKSGSKIRITTNWAESEEKSSNCEVLPPQKETVNTPTTDILCNIENPVNATIIDVNAKNGRPSSHNLTKVIEDKNYADTKNITYDNLIELRDNFHYL